MTENYKTYFVKLKVNSFLQNYEYTVLTIYIIYLHNFV